MVCRHGCRNTATALGATDMVVMVMHHAWCSVLRWWPVAIRQPPAAKIQCMRWPRPNKMKPDARFSFPAHRHSSYSEVYSGVSVPSRLISCPPSLPVLRSISRSGLTCLSVDSLLLYLPSDFTVCLSIDERASNFTELSVRRHPTSK